MNPYLGTYTEQLAKHTTPKHWPGAGADGRAKRSKAGHKVACHAIMHTHMCILLYVIRCMGLRCMGLHCTATQFLSHPRKSMRVFTAPASASPSP
jgi:hypothetical protein